MAIEIQLETKPLYDVTINTQRLEELLQRGKIAKHVTDDIAIKSWITTFPEEKACYTFASPFIRLGRSEKNLSYAEKVAQSIKMLDIALEGVVTGRGSSYGPRDYITSDFDFIMSHKVEDIVEDISEHENIVHRVRDNTQYRNSPFFITYNFERETTQLFIENGFPDEKKRQDEVITKLFETGDGEHDMIIPFSILPAFPVYNVDIITLVDSQYQRGPKKVTVYTANGKDDVVFLPENFFSM